MLGLHAFGLVGLGLGLRVDAAAVRYGRTLGLILTLRCLWITTDNQRHVYDSIMGESFHVRTGTSLSMYLS